MIITRVDGIMLGDARPTYFITELANADDWRLTYSPGGEIEILLNGDANGIIMMMANGEVKGFGTWAEYQSWESLSDDMKHVVASAIQASHHEHAIDFLGQDSSALELLAVGEVDHDYIMDMDVEMD